MAQGLDSQDYTRLLLINTGQCELAHYHDHSRRAAERFGQRHEEIPGSNTLINKTPHGRRNGESVVACPGETISYLDFDRTESQI
jgi:hypothetical protein